MRKKSVLFVVLLIFVASLGTYALAAETEKNIAQEEEVGNRFGGRFSRNSQRGGRVFDGRSLQAEIYAELKGITEEEAVAKSQEEEKHFMQLVVEEDLLEEYKVIRLEKEMERIDAAVAEGRIDETKAEEIRALVTERIENCTGEMPENVNFRGRGYGGKGGMMPRPFQPTSETSL